MGGSSQRNPPFFEELEHISHCVLSTFYLEIVNFRFMILYRKGRTEGMFYSCKNKLLDALNSMIFRIVVSACASHRVGVVVVVVEVMFLLGIWELRNFLSKHSYTMSDKVLASARASFSYLEGKGWFSVLAVDINIFRLQIHPSALPFGLEPLIDGLKKALLVAADILSITYIFHYIFSNYIITLFATPPSFICFYLIMCTF